METGYSNTEREIQPDITVTHQKQHGNNHRNYGHLTDFSNIKRDRNTARPLEISFLGHRERLEFDANIQAQDRGH